MSDEEAALREIAVDRDNLYREEVYTDLKVATIRCLIPITSEGTPDMSRPTLYSAQTTLMSQAGPVPVQCPLEASSLEGAIAEFPEAINKAVERPVVVDGQVVVRRMMNLSSSFDHRFVDGHDGAMMIQALKEMLEQPATIFITN